MDAEGGGGGRLKRPVVVEDFLREPRERGSSSGRCQNRCPARAGNLRGKAFAKPCGGRRSESSRLHYIRPCSSSIVDREKVTTDARAVEDPIAAIFDLAESVDRQTPKIRKTLRYVRWFVSVWLLLDFFLIILSAAAFRGAPVLAFLLFVPIVVLLLTMRSVSGSTGRLVLLVFVLIFGVLQVLTTGDLVFLGAVLVALFILGFSILELMRDLRSFFDYFALRHRVIQRVRQADPVVYVLEGKDAVQRILDHLASSSPDVRGVMAVPGAVAIPALLTGKTGLTYSFDAYVRQQPSFLWKTVSLGTPGFAVFVKAFEKAPTAEDLKALKAAIEDASLAARIPAARILVLWRAKGNESVSADAYEFLTKEAVRVRLRGSTFVCSLELAIERDDGTYDFIPLVLEPAVAPTGRPVPS